MPPKKSEAVSSIDIPDQPPTLESVEYVDALLTKAKASNVAALEAGVALALGAADHKSNLRAGIAVDSVVEILLFCASEGFSALKAQKVISWTDSLREAIVDAKGEAEGAFRLFKEFLVTNAEGTLRETFAPPEPEAPAEPIEGKSKKPDPKKSGKAQGDDGQQVKPPVPAEVVFLTTAELAPLAQFVTRGMLQHASLYYYVATFDRAVSSTPVTFTVSVQTPIRAPPLSAGLPLAEYEQNLQSAELKTAQELRRLQQEEEAMLEAQRVEAEQLRRKQLEMEEEERANALYFTQAGTAEAVHRVQAELETNLTERQKEIVARIAKLEGELGVGK